MAISEKALAKMAESGVIATLFPGTTFFLGSNNYAPVKKLSDAGVKIALATDYNPGSCHIQSMPFIISLACIIWECQWRMPCCLQPIIQQKHYNLKRWLVQLK